MMPVVRVSDSTFANLSTLKTWFKTGTPSETIDRVIGEAMDQLGLERDDEPFEDFGLEANEAKEFDVAPGLSFTKPLSARINGKKVSKPRWSSLLIAMISNLADKGVSGDDLVDELHVPAKSGRYEEDGFKFFSKLGVSVQGQSAPDAWKEIDRIAKKWQIPVAVEFWWRQNPKAQYPGKTGRLQSGDK